MTLQQQVPRTSLGMDSQPRVQTTDTRILGKEEMRDLRKQLQSEAENIARWKASTEVKSKNMQRDIEVKNNIIEDQRSNLMELQLHSEHLSQSLFQERQERELVNSKVTHTRQLFLTLQEQYEQLFQTVSTFQTCKDEMQKEHDDLIEKLTDLKQSFGLQEDAIENMISQAEENAGLFKNAKDSWEKNVKEKDQEIEDLTLQFESLKAAAKELSESLESATADLSSVESARAHLSSELDEVKASLLRTQEELKEQRESLTDQITKSDQELRLAREQLEERTKEFEEAAEKIQYLKKVNDTLEGSKSELAERVAALASRKQELEEARTRIVI
ncbi:CAP-Gly domain-containing linker protein 1-like isoform X2 [Eriocheir sinensis]|uniref:CAP-Gly domain-containing linker protein 1-like isoform X2 n=1 Tax=Eriocheir sinensis TaxID=95602 RepID=UPI0021C70D7E|nr:CAP-Gly domain-containing linker protein 1-like isoform X2 [Eriocheir sinensis]